MLNRSWKRLVRWLRPILITAPIVIWPSGPATGQAWIGAVVGQLAADAARESCLNGAALAPSETVEAAIPSTVLMKNYWARATSAEHNDFTGNFQSIGRAEWVLGPDTMKRRQMTTLTDPLAWPKRNEFQIEPIAFVRAGDSTDARGVWLVKGPEGQPAGYYVADFARTLPAVWGLRRLDILVESAAPKIGPYCETPGDIEATRDAAAVREAKREAKRAAKAARSGG